MNEIFDSQMSITDNIIDITIDNIIHKYYLLLNKL